MCGLFTQPKVGQRRRASRCIISRGGTSSTASSLRDRAGMCAAYLHPLRTAAAARCEADDVSDELVEAAATVDQNVPGVQLKDQGRE